MEKQNINERMIKLIQSEDVRPTFAEKTRCRLDTFKKYYFKKSVKILVSYFLYYTGIIWFHQKYFSKRSVTVLAYHSISARKLRSLEMEHSPENFKKQMEYLRDNYTILSLADFLACRKNQNRFPPRSVLITFDDGFRDNYIHAFPVLKVLKIPAVIFIALRFIDNENCFYFDVIRHLIAENIGRTADLNEFGIGRCYLWDNEEFLFTLVGKITDCFRTLPSAQVDRKINSLLNVFGWNPDAFNSRGLYLSWEEIMEMARNNIDFGSHSFSHAHLSSAPPGDCLAELTLSKEIIETKIGTPTRALAYPFGSRDAFNESVEDAARKTGYEVAFSLINEEPGANAFTVGRKMVDSHATDSLTGNFCKSLFASELAGLV